MVRTSVTIAIFTFLFAIVSAARISLDPTPDDLPLLQTNCDVKHLPESDSNLVVLPIHTTRSRSDVADQTKQKSENDKMFRVDLTPRSDFARFHAINRRFFSRPRPYRHFQNSVVIPRSEISHRNDGIITTETGDIDSQVFHRHGAPSRMKVKHDYGHHYHHRHQHHHIHHNKEAVSMPKHKFVPEKVKNSVHQHKEEQTNEHKASFMKSIRKFLKHTFE